jgi:hypothetical protein
MINLKYILLPLLAAVCLFQVNIREAGSCSVPVFRYALERWKPDAYKGICIYRGSLADKDRALLRQLEQASSDSDFPLNLRIREVETGAFSGDRLEKLLKGPIPVKLPALAIWHPEQMGKMAPLWTVALTNANVKALIGSPIRKELAENLIGGISVVWIFIPSGNSEKDNPAKALIKSELDSSLKKLAKMPFFTTAGTREKKLTYGFNILTLSRSDPEERFLLEMLMKSESDLYEHKNEPMAFPVFGRGRVLGCLFGDYIAKDKIQDAMTFLAASCSCEVKALNPGMDLLLPAQWDRVLMGELYADEDTSLPELTGVMPTKPALAKTGAVKNPIELGKKKGVLALSGITLSSALVLVFIASLVINYRRKKN